MKRSLIYITVITALSASSAIAADTGQININGAVSDQTCKITTKDGQLATNVTLQMPTVAKGDVTALSKTAPGAGATTFELLLTDCDKATAAISFSSPSFADVADGTLKNNTQLTGAAKGISVALHNNTSTVSQVLIGRPDDVPQSATIDATTKQGMFKFIASYVKSSDAATIVSGQVNTAATFDVTYQ